MIKDLYVHYGRNGYAGGITLHFPSPSLFPVTPQTPEYELQRNSLEI